MLFVNSDKLWNSTSKLSTVCFTSPHKQSSPNVLIDCLAKALAKPVSGNCQIMIST